MGDSVGVITVVRTTYRAPTIHVVFVGTLLPNIIGDIAIYVVQSEFRVASRRPRPASGVKLRAIRLTNLPSVRACGCALAAGAADTPKTKSKSIANWNSKRSSLSLSGSLHSGEKSAHLVKKPAA